MKTNRDPYEWDNDETHRALRSIRALKGVAEAYVRNGSLYVTTRGLKHRLSLLPLARITILMPLVPDILWNSRQYWYKYANSASLLFKPHPVIGHKIGTSRYDNMCVGAENHRDYWHARKGGPLMAVVQQLAMLQTIEPEGSDRPVLWLYWGLWAMAVWFVAIIISIVLIK